MFDWDKFKSGKLSVILRTKELAENFYGECKKHGIDWDSSCDYAIWKDGGVQYEYYVSCKSLVWSSLEYCTNDSVEWKGKDNMEKTFREVIADIKPGEVWDSGNRRISMSKKEQIFIDGPSILRCFDPNVKYKLKRKEYTFEEAFKAYEEGKEIESYFSGCRYKKENGKDTFIFKADWNEFDCIELDEIRSKWYIND